MYILYLALCWSLVTKSVRCCPQGAYSLSGQSRQLQVISSDSLINGTGKWATTKEKSVIIEIRLLGLGKVSQSKQQGLCWIEFEVIIEQSHRNVGCVGVALSWHIWAGHTDVEVNSENVVFAAVDLNKNTEAEVNERRKPLAFWKNGRMFQRSETSSVYETWVRVWAGESEASSAGVLCQEMRTISRRLRDP